MYTNKELNICSCWQCTQSLVSLKYGNDLLLHFLWEVIEEEIENNNNHELQDKRWKNGSALVSYALGGKSSPLTPSWSPLNSLREQFAYSKLLAKCEMLMFLLHFLNVSLFHLCFNSCKDASLKSYKCWASSTKM